MPRPLRSLRNRLTLLFALIVTAAIGIVYFYATPRLEDELVSQKLERLSVDAQRLGDPLRDFVGSKAKQVELETGTNTAARFSSSEVTVLQVNPRDVSQMLRVADSEPRRGVGGRRPGRGAGGGADAQGRQRDRSDRRRQAGARRRAAGAQPTASAASRCSRARSPTWRPMSS